MKRTLTMFVFLIFAILSALSCFACPLFMLYGIIHLIVKKENKLFYFTSRPPHFVMSVAYRIIYKIDEFTTRKT